MNLRRVMLLLVWVVYTCALLGLQRENHISRERFLGSVYHKRVRKDDSIFVSIASYRDKECAATLRSIYENATHPNKVFVGIVQQNKEGDSECEIGNKDLYTQGNVRTLRLSYDDAKGPCYARYLASGLYQGETYYFQIDSHTLFAKGWDVDLVGMMRKLPEKSVISHYPVPWESRDSINIVPVFTHVDRYGSIFTFKSEYAENKDPHFGVAGGMMVMPGRAVQDVYFDPDLDYVFHGEEMLYSARLYTHGYDFYSPTKNLIYHYYTRNHEPKVWDDPEKNAKTSSSIKIVNDRMKNPPAGYFGSVRTPESYIELLESKVRA